MKLKDKIKAPIGVFAIVCLGFSAYYVSIWSLWQIIQYFWGAK